MPESDKLIALLVAVLALALAVSLERREGPAERLHLAVQAILIIVLLFALVAAMLWGSGYEV